MNQEPFFTRIQIVLQRYQYSIRQFWKQVWPFKWDIWQEPRAIIRSISIAPYSLKVTIVSSFVIIVVSGITLFYGVYMSLTTDAAASGGYIQEGIVGTDFSYFNPVIESLSEAERKINALLYLPLYTIDYPDFLNDSSSSPTITPVLIKDKPYWTDLEEPDPSNRYKTLRFELRDDIRWSDGKDITVKDVIYSFDRIKEDRGNTQFKSAFSAVTAREVPANPLQFDLISERANPQLLYAANFSPVSGEYYGYQVTDRLLADSKSFAPTVTSGYFYFDGDTIINPDNPRGGKVANPIRDPIKNTIKTIVLTKNPVQNFTPVNLDRYIIRRADTLLRVGGQEDNSLQKLVDEDKIDIFTRSLGSNLNLSSQEVAAKLGLKQRIIPTNTYFNLYLNIQINDYFINQSLRQYIICQFVKYQANERYDSQLSAVKESKRLIPIQLGGESLSQCDNPDQLLDPSIYTVEIDERTGIKRVLLRSKPFVIDLVGFPDSEPLLTDIQIFFRDIGIPAELIKDDRINQAITDKSYNALFIPVTIASRDPYALLGAGGRDFSQIRLNNRILDYQAEENLYAYSLSNLSNEEAKNKLIQFFGEQYVMTNMFRSNMEINYSDRVHGVEESIPSITTFTSDIYNSVPKWYDQTKREWIWKK